MKELKFSRWELNSPVAFLIAANALVLLQIARSVITVGEAMWIYWFQSVIIGAVNATRMLAAREARAGLAADRISGALFFAAHYGLFHYAYFMFLSQYHARPNRLMLALNIAPFLIAQLSSLFRDPRAVVSGSRDLFVMMLKPYLRIIPMHITILLGRGLAPLFFVSSKTLADLFGYWLDRLGAPSAGETENS